MRLSKSERNDFTVEPVKRVIGVIPKQPKPEVTENDQIDPERPSLMRASPAIIGNPVKRAAGRKVRSPDGESPASTVSESISAPVTSKRPKSRENPAPEEQEDPEPRKFEGHNIYLRMLSHAQSLTRTHGFNFLRSYRQANLILN